MATPLEKLCTKCKVTKPVGGFGTRLDVKSKTKLLSWCRECRRVESLRRLKEEPYKWAMSVKKSYDKLREEFHIAYGSVCTCCGERDRAFLTLEHLNGSKRLFAERRGFVPKGTMTYLADLRRRDWPKDEATVLCFNCNCAKARVGQCPHQSKNTGKAMGGI